MAANAAARTITATHNARLSRESLSLGPRFGPPEPLRINPTAQL